MAGTLLVSLGQTRVGTLTNIPGDYNLFAFDPAYLADPDRPILSQSFIDKNGEPIRVVPRTHTISPPFFANLLPEEGTLLRSIIARQRGIKSAPDFPYLRALGQDLPGAVVVTDPEGLAEAGFGVDRAEEGDPRVRFSLAGMQLKFSVSMLNDRLALTERRGEGGYWIVKLPTNAYPRLPENEFAVMSLAAAIGLDVPEIALRELDSVAGLPLDLPGLRADEPRKVYAIKRFDRRGDGTRLHVEDFNQIAAQKPDEKYDRKATSYIASVISQLCEPADVDEFVRRLVFGICVGNDDMHLKNWAIAYPDGRHARLAPMYDYIFSRLYFPGGTLALTVGGERDFSRITPEVMGAFARQAEVSGKRVNVLVREVVEKIRSAWPGTRARISDQALVSGLEEHFARVPIMTGTAR
jgi:serine/threonine-protein kinase HipA